MKRSEKVIESFLFACSLLTILTTAGIISVLLFETARFFQVVSIWDFLTDTEWSPSFAKEQQHFGIMPLLAGTFLTTFIAMAVAVPLGITIAVYLSEYASSRVRQIVKPVLEILASIPTIVYGYFALAFVTPLIQHLFPGLELSNFNALAPGIIMGIMILPLVSSLSEDALYAVPRTLREGSYAMGATKFQTAFKVIIPAALSGIAVSIILALSRAVGETMIVAIAAGNKPTLTFNPLNQVQTATTYIVQTVNGDVANDSIEYKTIYAVGMSLFVITLLLNNISFWLKKRYQQVYK
ncbi:phosphate ABC transporter permease subunit PstC [Cytophaga hutchinsonii]|jgi:phosphate transport system permease protein|uniref:Phosphate transport system permease protein n=1 Tax=Cytophaga hutchinsonii (strain ATCC 33406 / DSM 1761 / CIP 103989 / NBRC 15051 / NCIMB 9469 / D465) TaxID=269798 RepID=A0A6N4SY12_CYTH3|nr:phosphate ABC transporter permease subunit PstC [Cytophaga hutchinsonii]ABG61051.1 phosphate ABC transporter membrane protein 1, PhoT family [Cytophaga hutchinsonii ATCC 33406]SFX45182.1 phosphate ABC transporter membrane protein 1, PhoT family [Cytophaga hutchinsonii ATCC 33406]